MSVHHISRLSKFLKTLGKKSTLWALLACLLPVSHIQISHAQEAEPATAEVEDDEVERIIVEGQNYDAAMKAFNSGDFATAELEFKKNAKCALRIELNQLAFKEGLQNAGINQNVQGVAGVTNTQIGQVTDSVQSADAGIAANLGGGSRNKVRKDTPQRTCKNRAFQLYMQGLSQYQLGKQEEAEKNFKTAVFLNKNIYDARFRLTLMDLLNKDVKGAKKGFKELQAILERCDDCEAKAEIVQRVNFVEKALNGDIKLN